MIDEEKKVRRVEDFSEVEGEVLIPIMVDGFDTIYFFIFLTLFSFFM